MFWVTLGELETVYMLNLGAGPRRVYVEYIEEEDIAAWFVCIAYDDTSADIIAGPFNSEDEGIALIRTITTALYGTGNGALIYKADK